jgi:hypothetical protein
MFNHVLVPSHSLRALGKIHTIGGIAWSFFLLLRLCVVQPVFFQWVEWENSGSSSQIHSGPMVRRPCQKYLNQFQVVTTICLASAGLLPDKSQSPSLSYMGCGGGRDRRARAPDQKALLNPTITAPRIYSSIFCLFPQGMRPNVPKASQTI